jgi:hypothetical protein
VEQVSTDAEDSRECRSEKRHPVRSERPRRAAPDLPMAAPNRWGPPIERLLKNGDFRFWHEITNPRDPRGYCGFSSVFHRHARDLARREHSISEELGESDLNGLLARCPPSWRVGRSATFSWLHQGSAQPISSRPNANGRILHHLHAFNNTETSATNSQCSSGSRAPWHGSPAPGPCSNKSKRTASEGTIAACDGDGNIRIDRVRKLPVLQV